MRGNLADITWHLIRSMKLGGIMLQIHPKSFLRQRGWFLSFKLKKSVDILNQPIPWWNYGAIDFVAERLKNNMRVLEFGSGGSTVWFANRVKEVLTIENHSPWANIVKSFVSSNVEVLELSDPGTFKASIGKVYDVMIVDALANRIECAKAGLPALSNDGVIIWDDTDGPDWVDIKAPMIPIFSWALK